MLRVAQEFIYFFKLLGIFYKLKKKETPDVEVIPIRLVIRPASKPSGGFFRI